MQEAIVLAGFGVATKTIEVSRLQGPVLFHLNRNLCNMDCEIHTLRAGTVSLGVVVVLQFNALLLPFY